MLESQSVPLGSELGENCWLGIGMFLNVDSVILFSLFAKRDFFCCCFPIVSLFFFFFFFRLILLFLVRVNGLNEVKMASSPPQVTVWINVMKMMVLKHHACL